MAKIWRQITGLKTITESIKLKFSFDDHHYMQCKNFFCKILSLQSTKVQISAIMSRSHIEPVSNKAQGLR